MSTYFTADPHFGHARIIQHCKRPFKTVEEMDANIVDVINSTVAKNDELYILGDFAWKPATYGFYRKQLNVRNLHIVLGNHDKPSIAKFVSTVDRQVYQRFGTVKLFLSHYPCVSWRGHAHGSLHLYGHSHGNLEDRLNEYFPHRKSMDVGIDVAWKVWSLGEIIERFK